MKITSQLNIPELIHKVSPLFKVVLPTQEPLKLKVQLVGAAGQAGGGGGAIANNAVVVFAFVEALLYFLAKENASKPVEISNAKDSR